MHDNDRWNWGPCEKCGALIHTVPSNPNWRGVGNPMESLYEHLNCDGPATEEQVRELAKALLDKVMKYG